MQSDQSLRILVAEGRLELLAHVSAAIADLGHEVVEETDVARVAEVTAAQDPDAAVVVLGESTEAALGMIDQIVHEATCPVIAVLEAQDPAFVNEAARRGIFGYVTAGQNPQELQSSIDIVLRRFAEYQDLEGAFGRRALTERAKGILMERHGVDEQQAFNMLRAQARATNQKIVDVANAVLESHLLLRDRPTSEEPEPPPA